MSSITGRKKNLSKRILIFDGALQANTTNAVGVISIREENSERITPDDNDQKVGFTRFHGRLSSVNQGVRTTGIPEAVKGQQGDCFRTRVGIPIDVPEGDFEIAYCSREEP